MTQYLARQQSKIQNILSDPKSALEQEIHKLCYFKKMKSRAYTEQNQQTARKIALRIEKPKP